MNKGYLIAYFCTIISVIVLCLTNFRFVSEVKEDMTLKCDSLQTKIDSISFILTDTPDDDYTVPQQLTGNYKLDN